jgi:hypothetical protein
MDNFNPIRSFNKDTNGYPAGAGGSQKVVTNISPKRVPDPFGAGASDNFNAVRYCRALTCSAETRQRR